MRSSGLTPRIEIEECKNEEEAFTREKFLIAKYGRKDLGLGPLLNLAPGGEGNSGYKFTDAQRLHQSAKSKNGWEDPLIRASRIKGLLAGQTEESKDKRSVSLLEYYSDPENRAKLSEKQKIAQGSLEARALKKAQQANPATKEKQREKQAILWSAAKRESQRSKYNKKCTIDGVIIFESKTALINALGQGKNGSRHPKFRYI